MAACRRWPAAQRSESAPAEQAEAYLRARDILAVYPGKLAQSLADRPALEDISFSVALGRIQAVLGASRSGKSTLARVVDGLHPATEGRLGLCGASGHSTCRRRVGS